MSANPIPAVNMGVLVGSESAYGTTPSLDGATLLECIELNMGPTELGVIRPKRDRVPGRGMTNAYIEGRQQPIDFTISGSMRARSAGDAAPDELQIYRAGGLLGADAGSNYTLTLPANPLAAAFASVSLYRALGRASTEDGLEAELLEGCAVRSLNWRGGDQELIYTAQGQGRRKYTLGSLDSVTLGDGSGTTLSHTAEESYRLTTGYYIIESEVILITAVGYGTTSSTITRARLSTSGAAHTAKPMFPYFFPSWSANTRAPISEAVSTVTIGGVATRCTSFQVDVTTGIDLLPPETGSKYSQGVKVLRYEVKARCGLIAKGNDVRFIHRAAQRVATSVTFVQGTGTGGTVTFAMPYCEIDAPTLPAPANDTIAFELSLRARDDGDGNNALTITLD